MPTADSQLESLLASVLAHVGAGTPSRVRPVPSGWSNRVLRVRLGDRRLVVRLPRSSASPPGVDRRREARVLEAAARAGLAPRPEHLEADTGVLVLADLALPTLVEERRVTGTLLRNLAATVRRIHALPPVDDAVFHPGAFALARLEAAAERGWPVPRELLHEAAWMARVPLRGDVLCHNDLNPDNLLLGDRLWVLDWELAGRGDPLADLIGLAESLGLDDPERHLLFSAYGAPLPTRGEETVLRRMHWLREYAWTLDRLAAGDVTATLRAHLERARGRLGLTR